MADSIIKTLDVFWGETLVGSYDKFANGSEQFSYSKDYLSSQSARQISNSLKLRDKPFSGPELRPFFAGLLPEEAQRRRIASYLGISETDDFAFLEAMGGECAGALSIIPHGVKPVVPPDDFDALPKERIEAILESLPQRPMLVGEKGLRLSLAGAQSKLPVVIRDGKIGLPVGNAPSTHILKPELSEWFRGIAANEHCCMSLARRVEISVPKTELLEIGKYKCLLVERYDRDFVSGRVVRIHQEDFCQALGRPPERKYQIDGGPLTREVVRLLRSGWSTAPALDVIAFVDLLMFNAIIGNADAHGKNYSMLYRGGSRRLAPGYDLVSTVCWPALSKSPAMKIGGCDSIDSICEGHWRKLAKELNLGYAQLSRRLATLCDRILSTDIGKLGLPDECAPVLKMVHSRAKKIRP